MARQISNTPTLTGKYANEFIKDMNKAPTKKEKEMFNRMKNPKRKIK